MSAHLLERTPAAVLWDMDGTLIDSEPLWLEAELSMLARYGIELDPELRNRLVGSGLRAAAGEFRRLGVPLQDDEIISEWATGVIEGLRAEGPRWRPGAIELLASLGGAGIPSAIVTMSVRSIADAVLEMLPGEFFAASVTGDEVAAEKPDPDPYLRGAELLGVSASDCLALEDSPTGLRSAHAAGAVAIGIPNLIALDTAPAHELWDTLDGVDAARLAARFGELRARGGRGDERPAPSTVVAPADATTGAGE